MAVSVAGTLALVAAAVVVRGPRVHADAFTRAFINDHFVPVHFNDGDSFRVYAGEWQGRQSRLEGFNTLESNGPVHQWGTFHPFELFVNAKMATLNGKRGTWHCFTGGETDGYGRLLLDCPDLAVSQIRRGLAHAMNVDDIPSRPEYLRAQQEAIHAHRGMWAHGVPEFIVTSLHSNDEDPERSEPSYNRLISTRDGHTEKWEHDDNYHECQWVCHEDVVADDALARQFALRLRADPQVGPLVVELSNLLLVEIVTRWVRLGELPAWVTDAEIRAKASHLPSLDDSLGPLLRTRLDAAMRAGELGQRSTQRGACALYVRFERRYGSRRADCLRGRGEGPP